MEIAPGVHRLTNGISNWYMFEDGGKFVLADAGATRDWRLLLSTLQTLQQPLESVEAILLTHAHSDHTGFAEQARSEAGTTVYVHDADAEVAKTGKPPRTDGSYVPYLLMRESYRTLFGLMRHGGLRIIPVKEVSTFADGEMIDIPGHPRVVHMPGHTAGSAALWFESRSAVCTGDCLVTRNPMTGRRGPQIMPASLNVDTNGALNSLAALERVSAELVLPGHGEPWKHGAAEALRLAKLMGRS
jgi:glyoxylase-like metal-dependent hydrolase (beta-lactamase superfamily II)